MNKTQWLEKLNAHWPALLELIRKYHPAYGYRNKDKDRAITAEFAEKACEIIREEIRAESQEWLDIELLRKSGDTDSLYSILNQTWFGIPESRDEVKKIGPIFNILCDLCEGFED